MVSRIILVLILSVSVIHCIPDYEMVELINFFYATGGNTTWSATTKTGWLDPNIDPCNNDNKGGWSGVVCTYDRKNIMGIEFYYSNGLSGAIPQNWGANLTYLNILTLSFQFNLTGPLPLLLSPNLTEIRLNGNAFCGSIPSTIWNRNWVQHTNNVVLDLSDNFLTDINYDWPSSIPPTLTVNLNQNFFNNPPSWCINCFDDTSGLNSDKQFVSQVTSIPTSGGIITLTASNFPSLAPSLITANKNSGDISCVNITFISYSILTLQSTWQCYMSEGTGANIHISVLILYSTYIYVNNARDRCKPFSYLPPFISSVTQTTSSGGRITIYGGNFGEDPSLIHVSVSENKVCSSIKILTPHLVISCAAPRISGSGNKTIEVIVDGQSTGSQKILYYTQVGQGQGDQQGSGGNLVSGGNNNKKMRIGVGVGVTFGVILIVVVALLLVTTVFSKKNREKKYVDKNIENNESKEANFAASGINLEDLSPSNSPKNDSPQKAISEKNLLASNTEQPPAVSTPPSNKIEPPPILTSSPQKVGSQKAFSPPTIQQSPSALSSSPSQNKLSSPPARSLPTVPIAPKSSVESYDTSHLVPHDSHIYASPPRELLSPGLPNNLVKGQIDPNELELIEEIGSGTSGVVYKGLWRNTAVAVKKLRDARMTDKDEEKFKDEAALMSGLRPNPNVVSFFGISFKPTLCIVVEFLENGSLSGYLNKHKEGIPIELAKKIIIGICNGLMHLHLEGIIHRDLAARNILLTSSFEAKISDMGMSRINEGEENKTETTVGPLKWMSPEAILQQTFSTKSDVWSLGVTIWEVLTCQTPFLGLSAVQASIQVCHHNLRLPIPPNTPSILVGILNDCWKKEPAQRPDMTEICQRLKNWK